MGKVHFVIYTKKSEHLMQNLKLTMNNSGLVVLFPDLYVENDEINFGEPDLSFIKASIKTAYEQAGKFTGDITGISLVDIEVEGENGEYQVTITFDTF